VEEFVEVGALKEFVENETWLFLKDTIKKRLNLLRDKLEVGIDNEEVLDEKGMYKIQGECASLRYLLGLPEQLIEVLEKEDGGKND